MFDTAEDTIQSFYCLILKVFTTSTWDCYLKIIIFVKKIRGVVYLPIKKGPKVEIVDDIPLGEQFNYLRPNGTITYKINEGYDVPKIEIAFEEWYVNSVRLWPKDKKVCEHFLMFERTPPVSPQISLALQIAV